MLFIVELLWIVNLFNIVLCDTVSFYKGIFNEDSKVTFYPDSQAELFGYSVLLSELGFHVGAPKARSRGNPAISPGLVFDCPLKELGEHNVTCAPLDIGKRFLGRDLFKDDMWFGATMGVVKEGKLYICAPRWTVPHDDKFILSNGACYIYGSTRTLFLQPLKDKHRQAFRTDGTRPDYDGLVNFYAYAQLGMSLKVTESNHVVIGAPGMLQWTGGIVDYSFTTDKSLVSRRHQVANPYYTRELEQDNYFGYSVESGVFENNGSILYVGGAPRSKSGSGQVLIFDPPAREAVPLNIRQRIYGPHLGSYFGASLCCVDINGDGRLDLLIGAPTFVKKDGGLKYDQGAVFMYLNREENSTFILQEAGYVSGSRQSGARFGISIASLGDVDGDDINDIAIGAPWENEGSGVVYIYQGSDKGLKGQYAQRIMAEGASGFGMSLSKGYDIDNSFCNDVAIGAHASQTAYLYRCVPTIKVEALIKVPGLMDLPENATNFTAHFCVSVRMQKWQHINVDFKATKIIDPELNRAMMADDATSIISVKPGIEMCDEHVVEVNNTADLSKPILIQYTLEPSKIEHYTRLSEDSKLETSFLAQMIGDCGKDLICTPRLEMTIEPLDDPYIPGTNMKLGAKITVTNTEEPAYGIKLNITLPYIPKRVPSPCSLEKLNMTCNLPAPLHRNESVVYEIELQYEYEEVNDLKVTAELKEPLYRENITDEGVKELVLIVIPEANFVVSGKSVTNSTMFVSRKKLDESKDLSFIHLYEVTNYGPSNWYNLSASIFLSEQINLSSSVGGCTEKLHKLDCIWTIPADHTKSLYLPLQYDLEKFRDLLEANSTINVTSRLELFIKEEQK
ncbi:integrin alpha-PS3 [Aphomia sociella]